MLSFLSTGRCSPQSYSLRMRGPAPPENQRGVAEPTNRNAEARSHPPRAGRVVATPRGARMRREYDGGGGEGPDQLL